MARTVAALYSTRAEAETAQARLRTQLQASEVEILSQHDRASLPKFRFSTSDTVHYQEALARGNYLLCAKVPAGEDPATIVRIVEESSSKPRPLESATEPKRTPELSDEHSANERSPRNALFVGKALVARGGAQVTYTAPEAPGPGEVRSTPYAAAANRFEERELMAAGLLQDRTIEASEMGEVPVISKQPVVREEVVIRKAAEERTEVVRDTVRRTATEVTDLGPSAARDQPRPRSE